MGIEAVIASPYFWLVVAAAAAVIEAVSFGLVTAWFVVGALVAFGISFAGGPVWSQLAAFLVVSVACLALLRPVILKNRERGERLEATPVGCQAVVVEGIDAAALTGRVETPDHMSWAAIAVDGSVIEAGAQVRVVGQKSVKLVVERLQT